MDHTIGNCCVLLGAVAIDREEKYNIWSCSMGVPSSQLGWGTHYSRSGVSQNFIAQDFQPLQFVQVLKILLKRSFILSFVFFMVSRFVSTQKEEYNVEMSTIIYFLRINVIKLIFSFYLVWNFCILKRHWSKVYIKNWVIFSGHATRSNFWAKFDSWDWTLQ